MSVSLNYTHPLRPMITSFQLFWPQTSIVSNLDFFNIWEFQVLCRLIRSSGKIATKFILIFSVWIRSNCSHMTYHLVFMPKSCHLRRPSNWIRIWTLTFNIISWFDFFQVKNQIRIYDFNLNQFFVWTTTVFNANNFNI